MSGALAVELRRKLFHLMSLVFLAAYQTLGRDRFLFLCGVWLLLEGAVEFARLRAPVLNEKLISYFGGIHREAERNRISGIFWTAMGCWMTVRFFGARPAVVAAAFLYLSLGDSAAALVGKRWGRRQWPGGAPRTIEGSAACFVVCAVVGWAAGLSAAQIAAGAVVATVVEAAPLPVNDNLWLPLVSAAALASLSR